MYTHVSKCKNGKVKFKNKKFCYIQKESARHQTPFRTGGIRMKGADKVQEGRFRKTFNTILQSWVWRCMLVILALRRQWQGDLEFVSKKPKMSKTKQKKPYSSHIPK
jgi:hypothetical protein